MTNATARTHASYCVDEINPSDGCCFGPALEIVGGWALWTVAQADGRGGFRHSVTLDGYDAQGRAINATIRVEDVPALSNALRALANLAASAA